MAIPKRNPQTLCVWGAENSMNFRAKDKKYTYEGMIQDLHGERLRSGIMVLQKIFYFLWFENHRFSQPQKYEGELERFMQSHKLNYRKKVVFA